MESLHAESTDQKWQARPRPRAGPIVRSQDCRTRTTAPAGGGGGGGEEKGPGQEGGGGGLPEPSEIDDGAAVPRRWRGGGDRLVKKVLQLDHLALYWNPAESGNPCSMHLSDIPVEQAEEVISRCVRD